MGEGKVWVVGFVLTDGRKGILLRPFENEVSDLEIGDRHPNWVDGEKKIKDTDTIIWCNNLEGTRILQEAINIVALEFAGYKVIDK